MKKKTTPNYKKIYTDLVEMKYPHKRDECAFLLEKSYLEVMDVIHLNNLLFGKKNKENQKYRSYDNIAVYRILYYQKKRSEEHTSELQSRPHLVCRLLLEKKK